MPRAQKVVQASLSYYQKHLADDFVPVELLQELLLQDLDATTAAEHTARQGNCMAAVPVQLWPQPRNPPTQQQQAAGQGASIAAAEAPTAAAAGGDGAVQHQRSFQKPAQLQGIDRNQQQEQQQPKQQQQQPHWPSQQQQEQGMLHKGASPGPHPADESSNSNAHQQVLLFSTAGSVGHLVCMTTLHPEGCSVSSRSAQGVCYSSQAAAAGGGSDGKSVAGVEGGFGGGLEGGQRLAAASGVPSVHLGGRRTAVVDLGAPVLQVSTKWWLGPHSTPQEGHQQLLQEQREQAQQQQAVGQQQQGQGGWGVIGLAASTPLTTRKLNSHVLLFARCMYRVYLLVAEYCEEKGVIGVLLAGRSEGKQPQVAEREQQVEEQQQQQHSQPGVQYQQGQQEGQRQEREGDQGQDGKQGQQQEQPQQQQQDGSALEQQQREQQHIGRAGKLNTAAAAGAGAAAAAEIAGHGEVPIGAAAGAIGSWQLHLVGVTSLPQPAVDAAWSPHLLEVSVLLEDGSVWAINYKQRLQQWVSGVPSAAGSAAAVGGAPAMAGRGRHGGGNGSRSMGWQQQQGGSSSSSSSSRREVDPPEEVVGVLVVRAEQMRGVKAHEVGRMALVYGPHPRQLVVAAGGQLLSVVMQSSSTSLTTAGSGSREGDGMGTAAVGQGGGGRSSAGQGGEEEDDSGDDDIPLAAALSTGAPADAAKVLLQLAVGEAFVSLTNAFSSSCSNGSGWGSGGGSSSSGSSGTSCVPLGHLLAAGTTCRVLLLDVRSPGTPVLSWVHGMAGVGAGQPDLLLLVPRPVPQRMDCLKLAAAAAKVAEPQQQVEEQRLGLGVPAVAGAMGPPKPPRTAAAAAGGKQGVQQGTGGQLESGVVELSQGQMHLHSQQEQQQQRDRPPVRFSQGVGGVGDSSQIEEGLGFMSQQQHMLGFAAGTQASQVLDQTLMQLPVADGSQAAHLGTVEWGVPEGATQGNVGGSQAAGMMGSQGLGGGSGSQGQTKATLEGKEHHGAALPTDVGAGDGGLSGGGGISCITGNTGAADARIHQRDGCVPARSMAWQCLCPKPSAEGTIGSSSGRVGSGRGGPTILPPAAAARGPDSGADISGMLVYASAVRGEVHSVSFTVTTPASLRPSVPSVKGLLGKGSMLEGLSAKAQATINKLQQQRQQEEQQRAQGEVVAAAGASDAWLVTGESLSFAAALLQQGPLHLPAAAAASAAIRSSASVVTTAAAGGAGEGVWGTAAGGGVWASWPQGTWSNSSYHHHHQQQQQQQRSTSAKVSLPETQNLTEGLAAAAAAGTAEGSEGLAVATEELPPAPALNSYQALTRPAWSFAPAPAPCHSLGPPPRPKPLLPQQQRAGTSAAAAVAVAGVGGKLGSWQLAMSCQGQTSGGPPQLAAPMKLTVGQEELARLRAARVLQYPAAYQR